MHNKKPYENGTFRSRAYPSGGNAATTSEPFPKWAGVVNASDQDDDSDNSKIRSTLISKNITILGRRTSVRLEPEMWFALKDIAKRERCSVHEVCSLIQIRKNAMTSLTAAIRVFLMLYYRAATTEEGHQRAGHGNFENMKRRAKVYVDLRSGASVAPAEVNQRPYGSNNAEDTDAYDPSALVASA